MIDAIMEFFTSQVVYQFIAVSLLLNVVIDVIWKPIMKMYLAINLYPIITRIIVFIGGFLFTYIGLKTNLLILKFGLFYDAALVSVLSILFYDAKLYSGLKKILSKLIAKKVENV